MSRRFRKKPVEIEAMRIDASDDNRNADGSESFLDPNRRSIAAVSGWLFGQGFRDFKVCGDGPFGIAIETLEGTMTAAPGDWIIRGVQGEFYPCKPDIFEAAYEPAPAPDGPCACGSPDTTSLNPREVVVHALDGCTIERVPDGGAS